MSKLMKLGTFDSLVNVQFNLLKDMLDEAGIGYITKNETSRAVKPGLSLMQSSIAIDVLVYEEDLEEAIKILNSIK